jgi:outer membrane immunogenic protein
MKKFAFCIIAWAGVCGSAQSADMQLKAPAYVAPPVFTWTGFYLGGVVGDAREHMTNSYAAPGLPNGYLPGDQAAIDAFSSNSFSNSRVTYGAEAGYNIQFNSLVVGAEFEINYLGFSNTLISVFSTPLVGPVTSTTSLSTNWMITARGRLGWAVFDRLLVFGTGGVAAVHSPLTQTNVYSPAFVASGTDFSSVSTGQTGWVAGGGLEYAVTDHWSIKGEYLHVGLPSRTGVSGTPSPFFGNPAIVSYSHTVSNEIDIGRFGINYKF